MIFQTENAIDKIIRGEKTQTRRLVKPGDWMEGLPEKACVITSNTTKYAVGHDYAVQPGRTCRGIWYNPDTGSTADPVKHIWDIEYEDMYINVRPGLSQNGYKPLRIRILSIKREDVRQISFEDALAEGYNTPDEFLQVWQTIHALKHTDAWAITFEVVK